MKSAFACLLYLLQTCMCMVLFAMLLLGVPVVMVRDLTVWGEYSENGAFPSDNPQ